MNKAGDITLGEQQPDTTPGWYYVSMLGAGVKVEDATEAKRRLHPFETL